LIRDERRLTIDSVAIALGCSHGLAYSIIVWSFRKCAHGRSQRTEGSRKNEPLRLSLQHLLQYADEGEDMLDRIVTGDESYVHHYQPE
jgi:hypothetical protein